MALIFELVLAVLLVLVAVPVLLLGTEVFTAAFAAREGKSSRRRDHGGQSPTLAVVVPAHNEATVVADTLATLQRQLSAGDRLIVVADNCTDQTAAIAAACGAEVTVRNEPDLRGKGYALDAGIRVLASDPPDVVVFVDADCRVEAGAIAALVANVQRSGAPQQAVYLMYPREQAPVSQRVAAFAFAVKNHVRLLGLKRLGVPCHLTGTGMAFPWPVIADAPLASGNLVEDMQLGVDLACKGNAAELCAEAMVTSSFPLDVEALSSQRSRWETGHLRTILSEVPRLIGTAVRHGDWRRFVFALDLAIPPLTLLAALLVLALLMTAMAAWWGLNGRLFFVAFMLAAVFAVSLGAAWWLFGRKLLPVDSLKAVPAYVSSKLIHLTRLRPRRSQEWVRTRRD